MHPIPRASGLELRPRIPCSARGRETGRYAKPQAGGSKGKPTVAQDLLLSGLPTGQVGSRAPSTELLGARKES
jgi:hypothetical protein